MRVLSLLVTALLLAVAANAYEITVRCVDIEMPAIVVVVGAVSDNDDSRRVSETLLLHDVALPLLHGHNAIPVMIDEQPLFDALINASSPRFYTVYQGVKEQSRGGSYYDFLPPDATHGSRVCEASTRFESNAPMASLSENPLLLLESSGCVQAWLYINGRLVLEQAGANHPLARSMHQERITGMHVHHSLRLFFAVTAAKCPATLCLHTALALYTCSPHEPRTACRLASSDRQNVPPPLTRSDEILDPLVRLRRDHPTMLDLDDCGMPGGNGKSCRYIVPFAVCRDLEQLGTWWGYENRSPSQTLMAVESSLPLHSFEPGRHTRALFTADSENISEWRVLSPNGMVFVAHIDGTGVQALPTCEPTPFPVVAQLAPNKQPVAEELFGVSDDPPVLAVETPNQQQEQEAATTTAESSSDMSDQKEEEEKSRDLNSDQNAAVISAWVLFGVLAVVVFVILLLVFTGSYHYHHRLRRHRHRDDDDNNNTQKKYLDNEASIGMLRTGTLRRGAPLLDVATLPLPANLALTKNKQTKEH